MTREHEEQAPTKDAGRVAANRKRRTLETLLNKNNAENGAAQSGLPGADGRCWEEMRCTRMQGKTVSVIGSGTHE